MSSGAVVTTTRPGPRSDATCSEAHTSAARGVQIRSGLVEKKVYGMRTLCGVQQVYHATYRARVDGTPRVRCAARPRCMRRVRVFSAAPPPTAERTFARSKSHGALITRMLSVQLCSSRAYSMVLFKPGANEAHTHGTCAPQPDSHRRSDPAAAPPDAHLNAARTTRIQR